MAPFSHLAAPKLHAPVPRAGILDRPRLNAQMADAFRRRLTLVAADAGFGKSTAVSAFLTAAGVPAVWYRLDATDNDPATFSAYLLEGLRRHVPRKPLASARRSLKLVTDWAAAAQLLSAILYRVRHDVVIVLDDFHLLASPMLEEGMTRWIEDLPQRVRLVVLTRVRPDLPLARWLSQGALSMLGPQDLRFTAAELREFLVEVHGLPLTDASLHLVAAKTEGWPAGIVLTLHAVLTQGPAATAQALATLSGSSREIYEYLAQEAFARQSPEVQRFLLATSVPARFDAELADGLLDSTYSRSVIDHLARSHLFIVPLDLEGRWYRYHHLFQEFLQRMASQRIPDALGDLHARAARLWELRNGPEEALHHFVAAGQPADAARLLAACGRDLWAKGRFEMLRRWLAAIPSAYWPGAPRLYLVRGNCEIAAGEDWAAIQTLEEGRRYLHAAGDREAEAETIRMLGHLSVWAGERERLQALVADVGGRVDEFPPGARAHVLEIIARAAKVNGAYGRGEQLYHEALAAARTSGEPTADLTPKRYLAALLAVTGRVRECAALMEELIARFQQMGWAHEEAHQRADLAAVLSSAGRLEEADAHLAAATALQPVVPCRVFHGNLLVARALQAARKHLRQPAEKLLREALAPGSPSCRYLIDRLPAGLELCLLLRDAAPEEARRLATAASEEAPRLGPFWQGRAQLAWGIIERSAASCVDAANIFGRLGLSHWRALALLHAAALADGDNDRDRRQAVLALRELRDEGWSFLAAQGAAALMAPYRNDALVGLRVSRTLAAIPDVPPVLALQCLGGFELSRDGVPVTPSVWLRSAPRRLLQYLAVQTRPVHREEIMESLWPNLEPKHAANQLRVALSQLRRILEPGLRRGQPSSLLTPSGSTLALARERFDIDLDQFRRALHRAAAEQGEARRAALREAVGIHRGDLFADSPYEEWVPPYRDRLARQFVDALAGLAELEEAAGRWSEALSLWARLLERSPEAEHAYRGMIRCYMTLGRAAEAVRAFEQCQAALAALGVTPSSETLSLRNLIEAATAR